MIDNTFLFFDIEGGVTAPLGFKAAGIHAGLRKNKQKKDLALIASDVRCTAAGVYTKNKVFAAPVGVTRQHLENGYARAVICNSGIANACTLDGYETAEATCKAVASELQIASDDVVVASTGVIGVSLPMEPIISGIPQLAAELARSQAGAANAAAAIMTTDTKAKEFAISFNIDGRQVRLGAICKGSGMIHPNLGTMLGFITTDVSIAPAVLKAALSDVVRDTFNMVSVDGDTSTNDMVIVMASGLAANDIIDSCDNYQYPMFYAALKTICTKMARAIASDGEGATKLLQCDVIAFNSEEGAKALAKSVISSDLVKTAMYGSDANWGRIICALGYAGIDMDVDKIDIKFKSSVGEIAVCKDGKAYDFDEDTAKQILSREEINIICDMHQGEYSARAWGCDLTYEYVRINGDYRS